MNDRILDVIDKMTKTPSKITEVLGNGGEYYFKYGKHTWSLIHRDQSSEYGIYTIYLYPKYEGSVGNIAETFEYGDADIDMVSFHERDIPAPGAREKFDELYAILRNAYYKIDDIFDDILKKPK